MGSKIWWEPSKPYLTLAQTHRNCRTVTVEGNWSTTTLADPKMRRRDGNRHSYWPRGLMALGSTEEANQWWLEMHIDGGWWRTVTPKRASTPTQWRKTSYKRERTVVRLPDSDRTRPTATTHPSETTAGGGYMRRRKKEEKRISPFFFARKSIP